VAGVAAGVRGWLENNAGDTAAARSSLREAHARGDLTDDHQLAAWACYMQAVVEDYAGDAASAERYAAAGLRRLRRAGSRGRPLRANILLDRIAEARASRGDVAGVEKTVATAHDIVSALPPEQHGPERFTIVDSMEALSPAYIAESAGRAYARLGRPDRFADVTADARRAARTRGNTAQQCHFRLNEALAVGCSADPDPERIADLAREGLALASPFQTAHAANRFGMVLAAARPFESHQAVRYLREYGAAWRADRLIRPADA
jgi:hypothetical protein